jgi:pimeloyl-ACP methyl ester carboxylesterase
MGQVTGAESFRVSSNGLQIAVEAFGNPADPTVLLVMGLATQMIGWPDELCQDLAGRGYRVVRFDNRDIGLSTHLDGEPAPDFLQVLLRRRTPPYGISDMATDTIGVIDALGTGQVHLVGASMGGFIAQTVALQRPDRLRSLTLIMTSTGSRRVGRPSGAVARTMVRRRPPATDRETAIAASLATFALIGSPGFPPDEAYRRQVAGLGYDRNYDIEGQRRQLAAVAAQPDRTAELRKLRLPTLVLHGLADPLVALSGGLAVARSVPGSRFIGYSGMGHDFPRPLWPVLAADIAAHLERADAD